MYHRRSLEPRRQQPEGRLKSLRPLPETTWQEAPLDAVCLDPQTLRFQKAQSRPYLHAFGPNVGIAYILRVLGKECNMMAFFLGSF